MNGIPNKDNSMNGIPIIINSCYGGFGIDEKVLKSYNKKNRLNLHDLDKECRFIPEFIDMIRSGIEIDGMCAKLEIRHIPIDAWTYNAWSISECDGYENLEINYDKIRM